jgi:hypothetical protein
MSHDGEDGWIQIWSRRRTMKVNMSSIDRVLRVLVGIAMVVVGFAVLDGTAGIVVGIVGIIPLLTGLTGWCPLYTVFKTGTKKQA